MGERGGGEERQLQTRGELDGVLTQFLVENCMILK